MNSLSCEGNSTQKAPEPTRTDSANISAGGSAGYSIRILVLVCPINKPGGEDGRGGGKMEEMTSEYFGLHCVVGGWQPEEIGRRAT